MNLPVEIEEILARFDDAGIEAYCVGGCVRDSLRGVEPHDWDICTKAHPGAVKTLFADRRCIDTGIRHGTVTVLWDGMPVEITTYRVDGIYTDHRHPTAVSFSETLAGDCARRDFTVNAMAYHPKHGIADFFGGRDDLEHRIIRCVGDPETRFSEDALRILRALRFSSCLDFKTEQRTAAAVHTCAPLLSCISGERIVAEYKKLLSGIRCADVLWEYRDVIGVFFPWISVLSAHGALLRVTTLCTDIESRMAGLLRLCGVTDAQRALAAMGCLPFDRAFADRTAALCEGIGEDMPDSLYAARRAVARHGTEELRAILSLRRAYSPSDHVSRRAAETWVSDIVRRGDCVTRDALTVSGRDIAALGYRGREIGRMLDVLLDMVMRDVLPNEREALLAAAHAART